MAKAIVKNPGDLPIIENPNKPSNTMAKSKTDKAIDQFSQQAKTAAYILGGQAIAAQANAIVVPMALENQSPTIQQVVRAGLPLTLGVLLAMSTKNEHIRGLSLGFGTQGVLEGIKFLMPNFNPQEGLSEGSHFVFSDENGNAKRAVVRDGVITTEDGRQVPMLPASKQGEESARMAETAVTENGELSGWDSEFVGGEVEYV